MANQVKTIFSNMSWMFVSQGITSVLAFIWTVLMARYLGVVDYGIFGFAVSLTGLLGVFGDFGIGTQIVRDMSADNSLIDKYMGNALVLKFLLSILYTAVIFVTLIILGSNYYTIIITMMFTLEIVIKNIYGLLQAEFSAVQKLKYTSIGGLVLNIATFVFILLAIYLDVGLEGIAVAYILANVSAIIYTIFALKRNIFLSKLHFDKAFCKNLIIWGIPFALTSIFYTVYYQIDIVMLTEMIGDYATGMYNASYKLINVLNLSYSIYTAVIFPVMSKLFKDKKELLVFSFEKSIKYLLFAVVPLSLGMSFYATDIITFIYGHQFAEADVILQVLIWTVCFLFVNGACSNILNASHREVSVTKIYFLAAIFNVVLNLFLIPNYSYVGASISTILSDLFIMLLSLYVLGKINQLPPKNLLYDVIKIIIASGVLGVALIVLKLNMWVAIPVSIIIYLAVLFVLKFVDESDKNIIHEIVGK